MYLTRTYTTYIIFKIYHNLGQQYSDQTLNLLLFKINKWQVQFAAITHCIFGMHTMKLFSYIIRQVQFRTM